MRDGWWTTPLLVSRPAGDGIVAKGTWSGALHLRTSPGPYGVWGMTVRGQIVLSPTSLAVIGLLPWLRDVTMDVKRTTAECRIILRAIFAQDHQL